MTFLSHTIEAGDTIEIITSLSLNKTRVTIVVTQIDEPHPLSTDPTGRGDIVGSTDHVGFFQSDIVSMVKKK